MRLQLRAGMHLNKMKIKKSLANSKLSIVASIIKNAEGNKTKRNTEKKILRKILLKKYG